MRAGILDLVNGRDNFPAESVLAHSIDAARVAEQVGFHRYWFAEHHNSPAALSNSAEVLISAVASRTESIRVGAGGVMTPNHPPLRVAEVYGTLYRIYGDRIDLGLGRAPGTDPDAARELRRARDGADDFICFVERLRELLSVGGGPSSVRSRLSEGALLPLFQLASGVTGADLAARLGMTLCVAGHFPGVDVAGVLSRYGRQCPEELASSIVCMPAFCASTEEEAIRRSLPFLASSRVAGQGGGRQPLKSVDDATRVFSGCDMDEERDKFPLWLVGTPEQVRAQALNISLRLGVTEFLVYVPIHDLNHRVDAVRQLGPALNGD